MNNQKSSCITSENNFNGLLIASQTNTNSPKIVFSVPYSHSSMNQELPESHQCSEDSIPIAPNLKILPMRTRKTPKLTLVLDLDETLVHSEMILTSNPDYTFKLRVNQTDLTIYVSYRPGLINFLNSVCDLFEVVIFTASLKFYAEQVLKSLDLNQKLKYKFYRDLCTEHNGYYIKDLRILGRDLSKVIIIDNSEVAFSFQPKNGILIKSWFNDQSDRELESIQNFLLSIQNHEDIRPLLHKNYCKLSSKN